MKRSVLISILTLFAIFSLALPSSSVAQAAVDCTGDNNYPHYQFSPRYLTDEYITVDACGWNPATTSALWLHVFDANGKHLRALLISAVSPSGTAYGSPRAFPYPATPEGRYKLVVSSEQAAPSSSSWGWEVQYQAPRDYKFSPRLLTDEYITVTASGWQPATTPELWLHVFDVNGRHLRALLISAVSAQGTSYGSPRAFPYPATPEGRYKLMVSPRQAAPSFSDWGWTTEYRHPSQNTNTGDQTTDTPSDGDGTCEHGFDRESNTCNPAPDGGGGADITTPPDPCSLFPRSSVSRAIGGALRISLRGVCRAEGQRVFAHLRLAARPNRVHRRIALGIIRHRRMAPTTLRLPQRGLPTGDYFLVLKLRPQAQAKTGWIRLGVIPLRIWRR